MPFVNLTPHTLNIVTGVGDIVELKSEGIARCEQTLEDLDPVFLNNGLMTRVTRVKLGKVEGLPSEQSGTCFIVSRLVAEAFPDRKDLFFPGPLIRDKEGKVIGCEGLSQI